MRNAVKLTAGLAVLLAGGSVIVCMALGVLAGIARALGMDALSPRDFFEAALAAAVIGGPFLLALRKVEEAEAEEAAMAQAIENEAAALVVTSVQPSAGASAPVKQPPSPVSSAGKRKPTKKKAGSARHEEQSHLSEIDETLPI